MDYTKIANRGTLVEADLTGLARKQLEYLLAMASATRYVGDIDPVPLKELADKATMYDLDLIYRVMLTKKTSGGMISSPFNFEDRQVRDGVDCRYVKKNVHGIEISPPFVRLLAEDVVEPKKMKELVLDEKSRPTYNLELDGPIPTKKEEIMPIHDLIPASAELHTMDDTLEEKIHDIGPYVMEQGVPKTAAHLSFMLACYTKLDKGQIVMGAPLSAFQKLGITAISAPGILTVATLMSRMAKSYLDKLASAKVVTMKGRPYADWLYSVFKNLSKVELAVQSHTIFTNLFPSCFAMKHDTTGAKYAVGYTAHGKQFFKNCGDVAAKAQALLGIKPEQGDVMAVPVMSASIPCKQTVPADKMNFLEAYKFLSSSRALRSEDDKLMSGLTQGYNGSGCPSRALARVRVAVKIILANVVRETFIRLDTKYLLPVISSVTYYRPEIAHLLYFEGDPVHALIETYEIKMRPGIGAWKGDVIDLVGEKQHTTPSKDEEWAKVASQVEASHRQKLRLYREAGARDITMRVRVLKAERLTTTETDEGISDHWYAAIASPHAGEVFYSTRVLYLPAWTRVNSDVIGLYEAVRVLPAAIPEEMIRANFRRNAQPLLQAVWCDPSDSFVYSAKTVDLEADQAYDVQLAAFFADKKIRELIEETTGRTTQIGEAEIDAGVPQMTTVMRQASPLVTTTVGVEPPSAGEAVATEDVEDM